MPEPIPPTALSRPGPSRLQRATAIVATVGVAIALVGLLVSLRPVRTPTQDCGTTLAFLMDGRTNEFVDVDDLPEGVTEADVEANNDRPCRERVADVAVPAFGAVAAGVGLALLAALTEGVDRGLRRHQRAQEHREVATT